MKIFNSLTLNKEEFLPKKEIKMYVCGPTTYDDIHVGNARPIVFFDTVRRIFEYLGYSVKSVSNFTDIDDRIIVKSKEKGLTEKAFTDYFIKRTLRLEEELNCLPHYKRPRVTEYIEEIISFIEKLVSKGFAYKSGSDVLFSVDKIPNYGESSHQDLEALMSGARIEINEEKKNPLDFVLWKRTTEGVSWDSPWGKGRPGWHTECVVMIDQIFGSKIDIHGGGLDLKFPHHENEIAQSLAINSHKIADFWMHNGLITTDKKKMSKSMGNDLKAYQLLEEIGFEAFRLLILSSPYRQPLIFNDDTLKQAESLKIKFLKPLNLYHNLLVLERKELKGLKSINGDSFHEEFLEAINDDFNFANVFTLLTKLSKKINELIIAKSFQEEDQLVFKTYEEFLMVLGLIKGYKKIEESDIKSYQEWNKSRENKDFAKADEYRQILFKKGLIS